MDAKLPVAFQELFSVVTLDDAKQKLEELRSRNANVSNEDFDEEAADDAATLEAMIQEYENCK